MKSYGIDMLGRFVIERISSLPSFNVSRDKGRLVYSKSANRCYYGSSSGWQSMLIYTDAEAITAINNESILSVNISGDADTVDGMHGSEIKDIPANTKMIFKQSSAPTGWTFIAEDNDRVIISTSTESNGGTTGGSWNLTGLNIGGHTLTEAELPNITGEVQFRRLFTAYQSILPTASGSLSIDYLSGTYTGDFAGANVGDPANADRVILNFGNDEEHSHSVSADSSWRPSYVSVITCRRDV